MGEYMTSPSTVAGLSGNAWLLAAAWVHDLTVMALHAARNPKTFAIELVLAEPDNVVVDEWPTFDYPQPTDPDNTGRIQLRFSLSETGTDLLLRTAIVEPNGDLLYGESQVLAEALSQRGLQGRDPNSLIIFRLPIQ